LINQDDRPTEEKERNREQLKGMAIKIALTV
jgi:hypothetical protein